MSDFTDDERNAERITKGCVQSRARADLLLRARRRRRTPLLVGRAATRAPVEFPAPEHLPASPASFRLALDVVADYRDALEHVLGVRAWVEGADVDLRIDDDGRRRTIAITSKTVRGLRRLHGADGLLLVG